MSQVFEMALSWSDGTLGSLGQYIPSMSFTHLNRFYTNVPALGAAVRKSLSPAPVGHRGTYEGIADLMVVLGNRNVRSIAEQVVQLAGFSVVFAEVSKAQSEIQELPKAPDPGVLGGVSGDQDRQEEDAG